MSVAMPIDKARMKQRLLRFMGGVTTLSIALMLPSHAQPDRGRVGTAIGNTIPSPASSKEQAAGRSAAAGDLQADCGWANTSGFTVGAKVGGRHPDLPLGAVGYADLLSARLGKINALGAVPAPLATQAPHKLEQLRTEAQRRQQATLQKPMAGLVPAQFIQLPPSTNHAIAVDASRSRLYLFENGPKGLQLVADHYASVGRLGIEKSVEGDQRTPLGVYYITSRLEGRQLTDFYGSGALLLNYPNEYDRRLGRTGSGIWLHGVPSDSYARSPNSTDGCVALANPELQSIMERVQPRSTPVVITQSIKWVNPAINEQDRRSVANLIEGWRMARASGDVNRLLSFYSPQFSNGAYDYAQWKAAVTREVGQQRAKGVQLKDLAILSWKDKSELLVVTFGEVANGQRVGSVKRQYWGKEGGLWKIFYEGVIG